LKLRGVALALYDDHVDGVHDFVLRVVRDPAVASDVVRQTFTQASELSGDLHGVALYALARRCALETLQQRRGLRRPRDSEREGLEFARAEAKRLADPKAVLFDRDLIELVWDSAAALSPTITHCSTSTCFEARCRTSSATTPS
jgi:DNA-directed RNA polymerase specialized sigma24 family protein